MHIKYIFVTGGVLSSLGKGLTCGSVAMLLEARGLRVSLLKLDPYLNVDPGTMNPLQHGEVYVTDDGAETDLDLGHYYRYSNSPLCKLSNATSGQIYESVIKKERRGDFLGKTVQVIPHVTDEIKQRIIDASSQDSQTDVVLVEIGGTVGDIESLPFLEAIRQFRHERPRDCINIHLTYVPYLKAAGELKSKPTQHSVQVLREIGIIPDILLCRCEEKLPEDVKDKISLHCSVPKEAVIDEPDVAFSIYEVPIELNKQALDSKICDLLSLPKEKANLTSWMQMLENMRKTTRSVKIAIVGKYLEHKDAYKSVFESLTHACIGNQVNLDLKTVESDHLTPETTAEALADADGVVVPGGFGERGWMGKILAAKHCRENKIPYFGLCLGMQVLCVEFARHVLGMPDANSTEMDLNTPHPIISLLSEQRDVKNLGGTMRLGAYNCSLKEGSKAFAAYKQPVISERHRHRYEFNNEFKEEFEKNGLCLTGVMESDHLCEIAEVVDHPWMVGVQYHPEFKSKPIKPHPLFSDFIAHAMQRSEGK